MQRIIASLLSVAAILVLASAQGPAFSCPGNSALVTTSSGSFCVCASGSTCAPSGPFHCGDYMSDGNLGFPTSCRECQCVVSTSATPVISGVWAKNANSNCSIAAGLVVLQYGAGASIFGNGTRTSGTVTPFGLEFTYRTGFGFGFGHEFFCHVRRFGVNGVGECDQGFGHEVCSISYTCVLGPCLTGTGLSTPHPVSPIMGTWTPSAGASCASMPVVDIWQQNDFVAVLPDSLTAGAAGAFGDGLLDSLGSLALFLPNPVPHALPTLCYGSGLTGEGPQSVSLSCIGSAHPSQACQVTYTCTGGSCARPMQTVPAVSGHWAPPPVLPANHCNISLFGVVTQERDSVAYFDGFNVGYGLLKPTGGIVIAFAESRQYCTANLNGASITGTCVSEFSGSCALSLTCSAGACRGQVQGTANGNYPAQIAGAYMRDMVGSTCFAPDKIYVQQIGNYIATVPAAPGFSTQVGFVDNYGQMLLHHGFPPCAAYVANGVVTGGCLISEGFGHPPSGCTIKYTCVAGECLPALGASNGSIVGGVVGGLFAGLGMSIIVGLITCYCVRRGNPPTGGSGTAQLLRA
eukprot:TRINITY_DN6294_c0_g1_i1.p1 TRINITY_DN6294_c0_g1~~TRINITY_DN6294_c0_g1_i1.p1  ORF type:complete len:576 (+),score=99.09 TRINITY_DN6294_c0_g1_i1:206-1933(+)